jgi:hypothetical protein
MNKEQYVWPQFLMIHQGGRGLEKWKVLMTMLQISYIYLGISYKITGRNWED